MTEFRWCVACRTDADELIVVLLLMPRVNFLLLGPKEDDACESFHMKSAKIWQFSHSKFLIFLNFFPDVLHTLLWKNAEYGIRIPKTHRVTLIYSWLGLSATSQLVNFKQFQKQISQEPDNCLKRIIYPLKAHFLLISEMQWVKFYRLSHMAILGCKDGYF